VFDFRYHALSLMAVFIALAVGLLLGVAIGDQELVSSARNDVRDSLRKDVRQANQERDDARSALAEQRTFIDEAYPILSAGRLRGRSIGVVLLGDEARDTVRRVRDALEPTGADIKVVAAVRDAPELGALAARASGTRYDELERDDRLLRDFGRRIGIQMVEGGRLVGRARTALLSSLSGELGGLDGVVLMRSPDRPEDRAAAERADTLSDGIARGLADTGVAVVGIENQDTEPSQVGWYRDRDLSSVDDMNQPAGRAALVFALAGSKGAFGTKDSAQALLPPVVGQP
jgi:hypothetical protein